MNLNAGKYWDKAWQLVDGCSPVSAGCDNCWSASMTHRFKKELTDKSKFNGAIRIREDRLDLPPKTKRPTVFSLWNDLGHPDIPDDFIFETIDVMRDYECQHHTFLILTKRLQRFVSLLKGYNLANAYWGTSIENQQTADERIPHLLQIPGKKFLSIEPMLGPIDLKLNNEFPDAERNLSQVICGGETGRNARPCHPDWVRSIRNQCQAAGVPFFFKGWGEWYADKKRIFNSTSSVIGRDTVFHRVGHKAAGRVLDGRTHDDLVWKQ